jgi:CheY-like chemotaxis protein
MQTHYPIETEIKLKVLLADNNPLMQRLCGYTLAGLQCHVTIANSSQQVITLLKQHSYDVIFFDLGLDNQNGLEFANQLRLMGYKTPLIAICPCGAYLPRILQKDIDGCISKPFASEEARRVLRKIFPEKFY